MLALAVVTYIRVVEFIKRFIVAPEEFVQGAVAKNSRNLQKIFKLRTGELTGLLLERIEESPR